MNLNLSIRLDSVKFVKTGIRKSINNLETAGSKVEQSQTDMKVKTINLF